MDKMSENLKSPQNKSLQGKFMLAALNQAKLALKENEVPVGAILVKDEKIIAQEFNKNIQLNDPTAHAEILAMRLASKILNSHRLDGCDLYITLEPCAMCAAAISLARIRRIYYGASDEKFGAIENGQMFGFSKCYHRPEIYSGFYEKDCADLLKDFFAKKR